MVKLDLKYNGKIEFPETPEELTPEQYTDLMGLRLYYRFIMAVSPKDAVIGFRRAVANLLAFGSVEHSSYFKPERNDEYEKYILPLADRFILPDCELAVDSVKNLLPEFQGFKGPGDMLGGMTFGDVTRCLTIISTEWQHGDFEEIVEIMYKGTRKDFNELNGGYGLLEEHCVRWLLYIWHLIATTPININGKDIDFSIIFKGDGGKDDGTGLAGVTFTVAESGVFGTVKDVENSDFWEVMLYLYTCFRRKEQEDKDATGRDNNKNVRMV